MKASEILEGRKYRGQSFGCQHRIVERIQRSGGFAPSVHYRTVLGLRGHVLLQSFARWAREEVADGG